MKPFPHIVHLNADWTEFDKWEKVESNISKVSLARYKKDRMFKNLVNLLIHLIAISKFDIGDILEAKEMAKDIASYWNHERQKEIGGDNGYTPNSLSRVKEIQV